jgi:hypothetical protein
MYGVMSRSGRSTSDKTSPSLYLRAAGELHPAEELAWIATASNLDPH